MIEPIPDTIKLKKVRLDKVESVWYNGGMTLSKKGNRERMRKFRLHRAILPPRGVDDTGY